MIKADAPTICPTFEEKKVKALLACAVYAAAQVEAEGGEVAERMVRRIRNDKKLLKDCLIEIARATHNELILQAGGLQRLVEGQASKSSKTSKASEGRFRFGAALSF